MSEQLRPVLAGTDGSAASMLAVAWAARRARGLDLPLTIVSVVDPRASRPVRAASVVDDARGVATAVAPGLAVRTLVRSGDPVEVLIALGRDCELLVVGHRGAHGHAGPGPGSTSEAVARTATATVAVVDMDEERFPQVGCAGPALPLPAAVRQDRSQASRVPPLHAAGTP